MRPKHSPTKICNRYENNNESSNKRESDKIVSGAEDLCIYKPRSIFTPIKLKKHYDEFKHEISSSSKKSKFVRFFDSCINRHC